MNIYLNIYIYVLCMVKQTIIQNDEAYDKIKDNDRRKRVVETCKEANSGRLTRQTGCIKGETDQKSIHNVKLYVISRLQQVYSVNDKFIIYLFIKLIKYILSTKTVLNNV